MKSEQAQNFLPPSDSDGEYNHLLALFMSDAMNALVTGNMTALASGVFTVNAPFIAQESRKLALQMIEEYVKSARLKK